MAPALAIMSEMDQSYLALNTSETLSNGDVVDITDKKVYWKEKMIVVSRKIKKEYTNNCN